MKNAQDVENPLNLNALSAMGSIMQRLCQLSWRKTMGQMVKMERKAAAKPLILVCECKLPPFWGQHKLCLWKYTELSGISAACMAVLAPAH